MLNREGKAGQRTAWSTRKTTSHHRLSLPTISLSACYRVPGALHELVAMLYSYQSCISVGFDPVCSCEWGGRSGN